VQLCGGCAGWGYNMQGNFFGARPVHCCNMTDLDASWVSMHIYLLLLVLLLAQAPLHAASRPPILCGCCCRMAQLPCTWQPSKGTQGWWDSF
jgi:hypothetical protein